MKPYILNSFSKQESYKYPSIEYIYFKIFIQSLIEFLSLSSKISNLNFNPRLSHVFIWT